MKTSVIIPTMNRLKSLEVLLESIFKQSVLPNELIIIDQSERNYQKEISGLCGENNFIKLKYVHDRTITGLTHAKNKGIELNTSDILFFFDDDLELYPDFIEKVISTFEEHPEIYGICGRQHLKKEINPIYNFIRDFFKRGPFSVRVKEPKKNYLNKNIELMYKLSGGITAYRKEVTDEFLFDECLVRYSLGEDADYSYRVSQKYLIGKLNDAVAYHHHIQTGRYNMRKDYDARVCFYYYFYNKNVKNYSSKLTKWYLIFVLLGVLIDACNKGIRNSTFDPLLGFFDGVLRVKNNYDGASCINIKSGSNSFL
ncbi:glycosyltransferase family 2 protein [Bacillus salacetis]|uniref:glycosyltransferase family 2 protein n=1 Tax=Bacillus salacetis TaxID=2315464 RepID=UPI003BA21F75